MDWENKVYKFTETKHQGQLDDEGKEYFRVHILQVVSILKKVTNDSDMIKAGYLHDTLEDTDTTKEELIKEFGIEVTNLVEELTHEGQKDEIGYYFPRLKSKKAIIIKFADRLSNLSRMNAWDENRQAQYLRKSKFWKGEAK